MTPTDTDKQSPAAATAASSDYESAQRKAFALLDSGFDLGGRVTTTRDELHHRFDPAKYEYQSEFARRYYGQGKEEGRVEGKAEGRAEGRADLLTRQLTLRFGALLPEAQTRIAGASIEELDAIGERLLTARTLQEALGPH